MSFGKEIREEQQMPSDYNYNKKPMQDQLLEKIITIKKPINLNPETKAPIKFEDENGDKYDLWKSNKQGESKAYAYYKNLQYGGEGSTVGIVYKEEPNSFTNKQGQLVNYTQRTVVVVKDPSEIKEGNQTPNTSPQKPYTMPTEQNTADKPSWNNNSTQGNTGRSTEDNIRWCNALNNACLLISSREEKPTDIKIAIDTLANLIYKLQPKKEGLTQSEKARQEEIEKSKSEINPTYLDNTEEQPPVDDNYDIDSIPF